MIASLKGTIQQLTPLYAVLDVNCVGYKVFATPTFLSALKLGQEVLLHVSHQVREDGQYLYGFPTALERDMFEILIGVSGVGPRSGLGILSIASPAEIQQAVALSKVEVFRSAPHIGPKTAARLIIELKDKFNFSVELSPELLTGESDDVIQALVNLGYKQKDVITVLAKLDAALDPSSKLKQALSLLAK